MDEQLVLKNRLKEIRAEKSLSQSELAEMVGVVDIIAEEAAKLAEEKKAAEAAAVVAESAADTEKAEN